MQHQIRTMTETEFVCQYKKEQVKLLIQQIKMAHNRAEAKIAVINSDVYDSLSEQKRKHIDDIVDYYHPTTTKSQEIPFWTSIIGLLITIASFLYGDAILEDIFPK